MNDADMVEQILEENPALITFTDHKKQTPLLIATARRHTVVALILLKWGGRPDAMDGEADSRTSALKLAVRSRNFALTLGMLGALFDSQASSSFINRRLNMAGLKSEDIRALFDLFCSVASLRIGGAVSILFLVRPHTVTAPRCASSVPPMALFATPP